MNTGNPEFPILIVEDEEPIVVGYKVALARSGFSNIVTCNDSRQAMDIFRDHQPDLVLLDLVMPHVSGEQILAEIMERNSGVQVIVITGNDDVESAVRCIKSGAYDYLLKPVTRERLTAAVRNALALSALKRENLLLKERIKAVHIAHPENFAGINTRNGAVKALFSYIEATAPTSHTILITGETGTGKELFARAVHDASGRKGEFITVNAAGLDDNVFSDTLFGHKKGAFTGADSDRAGMLEAAAEGSIFLDEIGDLSTASQVKLLRLLQENEYLRLGDDKPRQSRARVIVATNADLKSLQESGKFRPDLYYRLSAHRIHVPPLRKRTEDIELLLDQFLDKAARSFRKRKPAAPRALLSLLHSYAFPGNIRELEGMVMDAVGRQDEKVLSLITFKKHIDESGDIPGTEEAVQDAASVPARGVLFGDQLPLLKDAKKLFVEEALRRTGGNITRAAEILGTTRQALGWYKKQENGAGDS